VSTFYGKAFWRSNGIDSWTDIIDNRQLNFDKKPDAKAAAKAGVPGAPRYKDRR
jgi:hypothetical protein